MSENDVKQYGPFKLAPYTAGSGDYIIYWDREEGDNRAGHAALVLTKCELLALKNLIDMELGYV